ncbi:hypothetical protein ACJJTC_013681 [Scirpophaga incertulas]
MVKTRAQLRQAHSMSQIPTSSTEPMEQAHVQVPHSISNLKTQSIASHASRSSATVVARKLAAEVQHTRHLAQLEISELEAKLQLQTKRLKLERKVAEVEHQAELAAIEADNSSRCSRTSVEQWVQSTSNVRHDNDTYSNKALSSNIDGRQVGSNKHDLLCFQDFPQSNIDVTVLPNVAVPSPNKSFQPKISGNDGTTANDIPTKDSSIGVIQLTNALENLNKKETSRLATDIVEIHKRGGFEMRGWVSNQPRALSQLPKELLSDLSVANVDLGTFTVVVDISHFSSWIRLVRATARLHQFIAAIFKNQSHVFQNFWVREICECFNVDTRSTAISATAPAPLDSEDITRAERHILGWSQLATFGEELKALRLNQPVSKKSRIISLTPALNNAAKFRNFVQYKPCRVHVRGAKFIAPTRPPAATPRRILKQRKFFRKAKRTNERGVRKFMLRRTWSCITSAVNAMLELHM